MKDHDPQQGEKLRPPVDYAQYQREYDENLEYLNTHYRTAAATETARLLQELLWALNDEFDPLIIRPRPAATLSGKLRLLLRNLIRRLVRFGLADEFAAIQKFNTHVVQLLNQSKAALDHFALSQRDFNVRLANFGQKIIPVVDGKVFEAYTTLDATICKSTGLLMNRMDLIFSEIDGRQETFENHIQAIDQGMTELNQWLHNTAKTLDEFRAQLDRSMLEYRQGLRLQHKKLEQLQHDRSLQPLVPGSQEVDSRRLPPSDQSPSSPPLDEYSYFLFEQDHRGDTSDVKARFASYLPLFTKGPVVDLGCGRGEFLELMAEKQIKAVGVDLNRDMVSACQERGFEVMHADLLSYLASLEPNSVAGIFAAQILEHLQPQTARLMIEESYRVLAPEGILVVETINPTSGYALVHNFLKDPTHQWPYHPDTTAFLMQIVGFTEVQLEYRSPVDSKLKLASITNSGLEEMPVITKALCELNHVIDKLNTVLFGDCDYAAIARK